ncbi:MAG: hypothetical protein ACJAXK_000288 [Yoonia sp.]|jgi:hypothetical protein
MAPITRQFLICILSYVIGLVLATGALLGVVDLTTVGLDSGLPTVAMLTPMIAVVGFWAVTRMAGVPLDPMRTFLFGGIAIYSLLYLCGRLVANAFMSNQGATIVGALALFVLAFMMIRTSADGDI